MQNRTEIDQMRVIYQLPFMEEIPIRKDIVYKAIDGEALKMDVYYPLNIQSHTPLPAVLLVHGGSQPQHVKHIKESGIYTSWGQLIAASGFIAVMFKHRTDESFTKLSEAGDDVDDLVRYVRTNGASLHIDMDRLCLWAFSQGAIHGLRTALRDTPVYIRCIVSYYGGMSIINRTYFHFRADEETLFKEFSPVYHLQRVEAEKVAPLFIARAGKDQVSLNDSIDEFITIASKRNLPFTLMNHPKGKHGFDIFNDDARTREIIRASLAFLVEHLKE